jgi:hypothetical protein
MKEENHVSFADFVALFFGACTSRFGVPWLSAIAAATAATIE